MAVVSFITDFGTDDEYQGVMKGSLLRVNPQVTLVDISHQIPPFDTMAAARMLVASFPFFPEGTVHVVVVDPGVGSDRHIVAIDMDGHLFLVPDNGIASYLTQGHSVAGLCRIEPDRLGIEPYSETFHGRDLFAPVAARMASGMPFETLGTAITVDALVPHGGQESHISPDGRLQGRITSIDRFGNLITNIHKTAVLALCGDSGRDLLELWIGNRRIRGLMRFYDQAPVGQALMLFGSREFLEAAVNQGSAQREFQAFNGDEVTLVLGKHS